MSQQVELGNGSMEALLGQVADEFTARIQGGEWPDVEDYARRYPEMAAILRQVLPALQVMGSCSPLVETGDAQATRETLVSRCLGDFRLLRQIGRGGMGVVYEAEQISLGRKVALKVLPFAAMMDPRQLTRFQNEARAAAGLHHTNIVPVHFVGSERGVHYYAMQLIDGQDLASVVNNLRVQLGRNSNSPQPAETMDGPAEQPTASVTADTQPRATFSTEWSTSSAERFRGVAKLGIQAAEALDCAHQQGIVHRDVKPANLLVDTTGRLWVTDFGLAQMQSDTRLTMTGDLVGTLRYMSPEQALAKRVVVDHRTDIYSLGATLYELLTLEPVFTGSDRQELLRQIAFEEPRGPRRLNRAIPQELETIVLKAMERNPVDRYGTAQELAEDLRRFLEDRPILARQPSLPQRAAKWLRRHRVATVTAAALAFCAAVGTLVAIWGISAAQTDAAEARADAAEVKRKAAEDGQAQAVLESTRTEAQLCETLRLVTRLLRTRDVSMINGIRNAKDVHRKHAEEALAYLKALPADQKFGKETRREMARAYSEIGLVFCATKTAPAHDVAARQSCTRALELFAALETEDPAAALDYQRERADVYVTMAWSHDDAPKRWLQPPPFKLFDHLETALGQKGNGPQFFLASMACAEWGKTEKARHYYDLGVTWMASHDAKDDDLRRLHEKATSRVQKLWEEVAALRQRAQRK